MFNVDIYKPFNLEDVGARVTPSTFEFSPVFLAAEDEREDQDNADEDEAIAEEEQEAEDDRIKANEDDEDDE